MNAESIEAFSEVLIVLLVALVIIQCLRRKTRESKIPEYMARITAKVAKAVLPSYSYRLAWEDEYIRISKEFSKNGRFTGGFKIRNLSENDLTSIYVKLKGRNQGIQVSERVISIQHLKSADVAREYLSPSHGLLWGDENLEVFEVRYVKKQGA